MSKAIDPYPLTITVTREMTAAGAAVLSDDGNPLKDVPLLEGFRAMQVFDAMIAVHQQAAHEKALAAEQKEREIVLAAERAANAKAMAEAVATLSLHGAPLRLAEIEALKRFISLVLRERQLGPPSSQTQLPSHAHAAAPGTQPTPPFRDFP